MKALHLLTIAAISLAGAAYAEDMKGPGGHHRFEPSKTRAEAIEKTKGHLTKLESMTDEEWAEKREERKARREKWKAMTPEERKAMREKKMEHKVKDTPAADHPAEETKAE